MGNGEYAKNTLDVYMIHQTPGFYTFLWTSILQSYKWQCSPYFIIWYVLAIVATYVGCSIIGRLRVQFIEPVWTKSKLFNSIVERIDIIYKNVEV